MPKLNLKGLLLSLYIPSHFLLVLIVYLCLLEICLWSINYGISNFFYYTTENQWRYQIGIRTIPVVIGVAGALMIAYFSAERNKRLDAEKHRREMAHKQIDTANAWLLDVKLAYDNLLELNLHVNTTSDGLKKIGFTDQFNITDPNVKLTKELLSLNFLIDHGNYLESTASDFNNILSIKHMVTKTNFRLPIYIKELKALYLKIGEHDKFNNIADEDTDMGEALDFILYPREQAVESIIEYKKDISNVIAQLKTFLVSFPQIAESNISLKYQEGYMKVLRFNT